MGYFRTLYADGGEGSVSPNPVPSVKLLERFSIAGKRHLIASGMNFPNILQGQWNDMYRVWDASKYMPMLLMTSCQVKVIQGHEVKSANLKFRVLFVWYMYLKGQFLVKNAKNDPWTAQIRQNPKLGKWWNSNTVDTAYSAPIATPRLLWRPGRLGAEFPEQKYREKLR